MTEINGVGNLRQSGIKPLRSTAKARDNQDPGAVQTFQVDALRNGGTMKVSPGAESQDGEGERTVREQYQGRHTPRNSRRAQNSNLPVEEQLGKLSKLQATSKQYEAYFMNEFTKHMFKSPLGDSAGSDTYRDIAIQPFRDYLGEIGGVGLADDIVNQIARQEGLERTLQEYPEVMGPGWQPRIPPNLMKKGAGGLEIGSENQDVPANRESAVKAGNEPDISDKNETEPEKTTAVGQMSDEEIAWLYRDAADGLA